MEQIYWSMIIHKNYIFNINIDTININKILIFVLGDENIGSSSSSGLGSSSGSSSGLGSSSRSYPN